MTCHLAVAHHRRSAVEPARHVGGRGVAIVEMAFVFPIFVVLIVGAVDLGMAVLQSSQATSAAVDATRVGAVMRRLPDTANCAADSSYQELIAAAQARITSQDLGCENVVVTCITPSGGEVNCAAADTLNDRIKVDVRWEWEAFSPAGHAAPIGDISGTSTVRLVPQPQVTTGTTFPIP
jgi:Flp pilus assembly protein TadG